MFERFTRPAREVVVRAQEEARGLGHGWIGTEHLLLAALRAPDQPGAATLVRLGVSAESCRAAISGVVGGADGDALGPEDAEALRAFGIDLEEIRRRAESAFGDGALDAPVNDPGPPHRAGAASCGVNGGRAGAVRGSLRPCRPARRGTSPSRDGRRRRWSCRCARRSRARTATSAWSTSYWRCCAGTTGSRRGCSSGWAWRRRRRGISYWTICARRHDDGITTA